MLFVQKINGYCLQSVKCIYVSKFIRLHSLYYLGNVNCLFKEIESLYLFAVESELFGGGGGGGGGMLGVDISKSNSTT